MYDGLTVGHCKLGEEGKACDEQPALVLDFDHVVDRSLDLWFTF